MSVLWLRTAAALYSCGLLYALIYLFRRSTRLFTPALIAFAAGAIFHLVSLVELRAEAGHLLLFDRGVISGRVLLLPHRYLRRVSVSACVFHDAHWRDCVPGCALEQPCNPQRLADRSCGDRFNWIRGTAALGSCIGLLLATG